MMARFYSIMYDFYICAVQECKNKLYKGKMQLLSYFKIFQKVFILKLAYFRYLLCN